MPPADIQTTYQPGSVSTVTQPVSSGNGSGLGGDLNTLLQAVIRKKLLALKGPTGGRAVMGGGAPAASPYGSGASVHDERPATPAPFRSDWFSQQGAATRPVGLGPAMTPGMGVDPNLLPPWMRPNASQFVGGRTQVPTGTVGLTPDEESFEGRQRREFGDDVPEDTAPMLTPHNAAVISPRQRALQSMTGR
jgi:hypothetical protein